MLTSGRANGNGRRPPSPIAIPPPNFQELKEFDDSDDSEVEMDAVSNGSSSHVRFNETPVVIGALTRSDTSEQEMSDDFEERKHSPLFSQPRYPGQNGDDEFDDDSDSESVSSEMYDFDDEALANNTRISWGPNVQLGARIHHERKYSSHFLPNQTPSKAKMSNTLSTKDFDNLTKHNKLLRIYGISSSELKLLQGRRKAANKLGCIPINVFDGPARSPRLSAAPLKSAMKPRRNPTVEQLRHQEFLQRKCKYEEEAVKNITAGGCLIKYGPRGKPTRRWFCISSDRGQLQWAHSAKRKKRRKLYLGDLIDVIPGKGFLRFRSAGCPPWLCITLVFTTRHLHISCPNIASFTDWFLGLQSLAPLSSCNMTRGMLTWYRAIWKLDQQAAGIPKIRSQWIYPNELQNDKNGGGTMKKKKKRAKRGKMTW